MGKRIVIIQGHPSREQTHFGHALAAGYAEFAKAAGHDVREVVVAALDFPLLRSVEEWRGPVPPSLAPAQEAIQWAQHLVIIFPNWSGTMPALLKGFFEQVARPGFAFRPRANGRGLEGLLTGKSARLVVTMGMPVPFFRWVHGAFGVRCFARGFFPSCGIRPVRTTYIGEVNAKTFPGATWVEKMRALGSAGA